MTDAATILAVRAERAAWQRYRYYVTEHLRGSDDVFAGDDASRSLFREWRCLREAREERFSTGWGTINRRRRKNG